MSIPDYLPFGVADIQSAMDTRNAWQQLAPNYPSPGDLNPQALSAADMVQAARAFVTGDDAVQLSGLGNARIAFVDRGETKICSQLQTACGSLALQVVSSPVERVRVPRSSTITVIDTLGRERQLEYSDARVYLQLPLSGISSIRFQEWAGAAAESGLSISRIKAGMEAQRRAMRNIIAATPNIQSAHLKGASEEAKKRRHQLYKPGHKTPLLIDVAFNEFKLDEYDYFAARV